MVSATQTTCLLLHHVAQLFKGIVGRGEDNIYHKVQAEVDRWPLARIIHVGRTEVASIAASSANLPNTKLQSARQSSTETATEVPAQ